MSSGVRRITLALTASVALMLGAASGAAAACPDEALRSLSLTEVALEQSVLCLINEERAAAGIAVVVPNAKLRAAGVRHSADMVRRGYFGHTSPTGTGFIERIVEAGYTHNARTWLVGENLVWGSGGLSSPAELVLAWMNSPPHRANLLRSRFRDIGIGVVRGTPFDPTLAGGVTVSSEYGHRSGRVKGKAKERDGRPRGHRR